MIASLDKWLETYPAIGEVEIEFGDDRGGLFIKTLAETMFLRPLDTNTKVPDLRTILAADKASEVEEMVQCASVPGVPYGDYCWVTARLYLWDGEPVDWADLFTMICDKCDGCGLWDEGGEDEAPCEYCEGDCFVPRPLTAVVLVGNPPHGAGVPALVEWHNQKDAAIAACLSAGVQWINPNDAENRRLEL